MSAPVSQDSHSGLDISFGSACSGIESASIAWEPLGLNPVWFSEIEPFPSAVLDFHWPSVVNLGDMTLIAPQVEGGLVVAPDVLVGGTPCQAFSVAGMREGLSDPRGELTIKFVELADAIDQQRFKERKEGCVVVWENVPGVLSSRDNAFGCFLGALAGEDSELHPSGKKWPNAGCVYGPKRAIAWRVLDAQYFGVAQRRRRVFVVSSSRKGFDPAAVLFESEGLRRDSAPCRETGQEVAGTLASRSRAGGFPGTDEAIGGYVQPVECYGGGRTSGPVEAAACLTARGQRIDFEVETFAVHGTQDPCVSDKAFCLGRNSGQENAVFHTSGAGFWQEGFGCLRAREQDSHENLALGFRACGQDGFTPAQVSPPVLASDGGGSGVPSVMDLSAVRRLMPEECEKLQGFPVGHTRIPWRGKSADKCPDGPRYKAIGNSKAVPVVRWVGRRIVSQLVKS